MPTTSPYPYRALKSGGGIISAFSVGSFLSVDLGGGVIRLPARRSKTRKGRMLPISPPLRQVLNRRARLRRAGDPRVFRRDGVPVRVWRHALRDACRKAKVPHRLLHDCRRGRIYDINCFSKLIPYFFIFL